MTDQRSTLGELNERRLQVEEAIAAHHRVSTGSTDLERADWYQRAYLLHEQLVGVLELIETAAWRDAPHMAGAMRWAITGARLTGERFRDSGIEWLKMAARS